MPAMIRAIGTLCTRVFQAICPDPFVIAILLTLVTVVAALLCGQPPERAAAGPIFDAWHDPGGGYWKLLAFAMQMCLILVTGHALASAPVVDRAIQQWAGVPKTASGAAGLVAAVACLAALINWGLGLIVGALFARAVGEAMARKGVAVHYPLLAAAGYLGLMVWHGGLSGSAPLSVTSLASARGSLPESALALLPAGGIPLGQTLFSPLNLAVTGGLVLLAPILAVLVAPTDPRAIRPISDFPVRGDSAHEPAGPDDSGRTTLPDRLNHSVVVALLLAIPLVAAVGRFVWLRGGVDAPLALRLSTGMQSIGLNEINMVMLAVGLIAHGSPVRYMAAAEGAARGCAGIMIQFPLYAGIMGIMVESGLAARLADLFSRVDAPQAIPVLSFVAAALLNLFIPSGGGQWAVQGPIALAAGHSGGIEPGTMVMAVAYGDQLTNMLQPFWALPLLAITGVRARDIVGYTATIMLFASLWIAACLWFLG